MTTLPRTVHPRARPLDYGSIVLDQRRGLKVWQCLGRLQKELGLGGVQQGYGIKICQSNRACVLLCP